MAYRSFERVFLGCNDVWVFLDNKTLLNNKVEKYCYLNRLDFFSPSYIKKAKKYDLIVLHGLNVAWYPLLSMLSKKVKVAWIGWGFDYYPYISKDVEELLLPDTRKKHQNSNNKEISVSLVIRKVINRILFHSLKSRVLSVIDSLSTVIEEDYELIKKAGIIDKPPHYLPWNYGTLEGDLVKGFIGQRISGNKVLLGNSATTTNNHMEAIDLLSVTNKSIEVVLPLSYGDSHYRDYISQYANQCFGGKVTILKNFMSMEEYILILKSCGFVIMNHKRQQALGNIVIMLYMGARVFLREENPVYKSLIKDGATINTINELSRCPDLLQKPLSEIEIKNNIQVLESRWSEQAIDLKTFNLVKFHIGNHSSSLL